MLANLFRLDYASFVTFLPKSITTAIGMVISEQLGGYVALTVVAIVITGVLGSMIAESVCKIFKIEEPIAKGIGANIFAGFPLL